MLVLHAVAFLLFVGRSALADDDPIVEMPLGKVRGYTMTSRSGRKFLAFSSIPYAKPPVGEKRFQPPEAVPIWRGIKDATKELPLCIQHNIFAEIVNSTGPLDSGVEDCLYLSVFTHSISGKAPVLFHIYGGGFAMGWGQLYGPEFLMDEDIVIVNINYRVGIFGFLSFESPELPGNQGLKDQVQALRWVQQNIASFGGDPNQVTIIGESAGGASVYHHIISPLSKGLFHKAIAESGTSYTTWALAVPGFARSRAERLAAALDCPKDPKQAVSCLSKKDPFEILSKFSVATDNLTGFGPVMEGSGANSFISQNPSKWTHEPVPLLMGITSAEGLILTLPYLLRDPELKNLSRDFNQLAPALFSYSASASDPATITNKLRKFYFPNKEITLVDWVNLNKLTSDSFMNIPVMEGADKHEGDVYFYYFDYKPKNFPPGVDEKLIVGANHCFEVPFIWSNISDTYYPPLVSEKDVGLSKALVKLVGNFIKNGVPTIDGSKMEWKKWTAENHNYIHLNSNGFHLKKGLIDGRYNFWKGLNYKDKMEIPVTM